MTRRPPPLRSVEDRLAVFVAAAMSCLLSLLVVGVVLAMVDLHHAGLHIPLALVGAVLVFRLMPRSIGVGSPRGAGWVVAMLIVFSLTVGAVAAGNAAELVIAGRDGATYSNTARFLVDGTGLFPDAVEPPFAGIPGLEFQAPGFVVRDDGTFWQQFMHANGALFAMWGELFGEEAIHLSNAPVSVIALLAVYVLGRTWLRPWHALLATVCVGLSLPFVYYSAATFSELNMLTLTATGSWVLLTGTHRLTGFVGGALLGGAALVRVDGWLGGLAIALVSTWSVIAGDEEDRRISGAAWLGFFAVGLVAIVDLVQFNRPYVFILGKRILALILAAVVVRLVGLLLARLRFPSVRVSAVAAATGRWAPWAWLAAGAFALVLRPLVEAPLGDPYGLEPLQVREGLAVEQRTYAELSMRWLTWYLGVPIVVLGWLTVGTAIRRIIDGSGSAMRAVALTWILPTVVYLWRPSVNPDHIWAMRRFLPVVIPGLCIAAVVGGARLVDRLSRGRMLGAIVVALSFVVPVAIATSPLAFEAEAPGVARWIDEVCRELEGYEGVLLVDADPESRLVWRMGPPLRAWCGQSVAGVEPGAVQTVLGDLPDPGRVAVVSEVAVELTGRTARRLPALRTQMWTPTLSYRPTSTDQFELVLSLYE